MNKMSLRSVQQGSRTLTPARCNSAFNSRESCNPKMKDTSRQRSIRLARVQTPPKVRRRARALRRQSPESAPPPHTAAVNSQSNPLAHPIRIHAGQQNLPGPALLSLASPIHHLAALSASAHHSHKPQHPPHPAAPRRASIATITACAPKLPPISPINSGRAIAARVDAHLIRPRIEHRRRILRTANPPTHRKRHKQRPPPSASPYPAASRAPHA